MTREETYAKAYKEPDTIRKIIKLHTLDTICGNQREGLNYVDGLYPAVESIFGIDVCLEALSDKNILKNYYEENYESDIDYNSLLTYFDKARNICDNLPEEKKDKILKVCNDVIDVLGKVYETKKSKKL